MHELYFDQVVIFWIKYNKALARDLRKSPKRDQKRPSLETKRDY